MCYATQSSICKHSTLIVFVFIAGPNNVHGLLLRSEVLYQLNHFQSSLADADNALKARPTSFKVSVMMFSSTKKICDWLCVCVYALCEQLRTATLLHKESPQSAKISNIYKCCCKFAEQQITRLRCHAAFVNIMQSSPAYSLLMNIYIYHFVAASI